MLYFEKLLHKTCYRRDPLPRPVRYTKANLTIFKTVLPTL